MTEHQSIVTSRTLRACVCVPCVCVVAEAEVMTMTTKQELMSDTKPACSTGRDSLTKQTEWRLSRSLTELELYSVFDDR